MNTATYMHHFREPAFCALLLWSFSSAAQGRTGEMLPPNAKAGECYARVWAPPVYRTEEVRVLTREASNKIEVIPARYEWVEEDVVVKDAHEKIQVIPVTYGYAEERVLVRPASKKLVTVPAEYGWEEERVLDQPAHTVWKKGQNPLQPVDEGTGEIMCLVEVPATYKTVRKRVLRNKAYTKDVELPAEYKTIRKRTVKTQESIRKIQVPAEYDTVRVRKLVTPAREKQMEIPEQYRTVTKRVLVNDGHMEWSAILCETNTQPNTVRSIQRALQTAGQNPGPTDGVMGQQTLDALRSFQSSKGLAQGGLTFETLKALGIRIRS